MGDDYPILPPISKDTAAPELELQKLQENKRLKGLKQNGVSTMEFRKNVPEKKYL